MVRNFPFPLFPRFRFPLLVFRFHRFSFQHFSISSSKSSCQSFLCRFLFAYFAVKMLSFCCAFRFSSSASSCAKASDVREASEDGQLSALCLSILRRPSSILIFCALMLGAPPAPAGNTVVAWGAGTNADEQSNNYGQSEIPASLTNAELVAAGRWHGLAVSAKGTLTGWGDDTLDQTAFGTGSNYLSIACGYLHSLALKTNGAVVAVGDDSYGQIDVPANVSNVVAMACGWYHCLVLKTDGTVAAWGTSTNPLGHVTDRVSYGQSLVPSGLSNVVAIAGGGWHSLALKSDGTITGWGRNDYDQATAPAGLSNVVAIAAGAADSLALEANGRLIVWGDNTYGQTSVPPDLTNGVMAIAAGGWHILALKSNGKVVAWGAGHGTNAYVDYGQTNVPAGLTNVIQIAAGLYNSLALVGSNPPVSTVPLTIAESGTNAFVAQLVTRNGRVYRLEYSSTLTNQTWAGFPLQAGNGGVLRFTDTNRAVSQRFYRVSQW